jgi:homoserine O-acetyltransferase/O-succinyltransferase
MIHSGAAKIQAAGGLRTLVFEPDEKLQLSSGESLAPLTVAFETYGVLNAARSNAVLVCHDIMGDQFVASPNPLTGRAPWWPRIVGPGRAIDTNRLFVICANVLGGSMGTTGPSSIAPDGKPYGLRFPKITIGDTVRAQAMLIEAMDIPNLFMIVGAGLGGMQAIEWASAYPKRVFGCATIASAARHNAHNVALNELSRQAIMADPDWRAGGYYAHGVKPSKGLAVARAGAQLPGLSAQDLRGRFEAANSAERLGFALEQPSQGVDRIDANAFLYVSRAMDAFDLSADFGGRLANAFQDGATRHGVFAFSSDWRYPPEESRAIARALIAAGADAAYIEVQTDHGNEAHLGEEPAFETALTGFVDAAAAARGLALQTGASA